MIKFKNEEFYGNIEYKSIFKNISSSKLENCQHNLNLDQLKEKVGQLIYWE